VGVAFIEKQLISNLPKNSKTTALKRARMEKWKQMIAYGLDNESASKIFLKPT